MRGNQEEQEAEKKGEEEQEEEEVVGTKMRVYSLRTLLFGYNWKDRIENKRQGQFMAAMPSGVGGQLAATTTQHQRRSRESHYAHPAK